jgi:2-oxo-4-hydroxy-4-carboxy-5-ureidoimidazoline decarboxylase
MTIAEFDHLPEQKKKELLTRCCGAAAWVNKMLTAFPVEDLVEFLDAAEQKWNECTQEEQREAFEHHPKIGDINSLKEKFAGTAGWAAGEQSGVNTANEDTLNELASLNNEYYDKFGFIFIICATGRSAGEMLGNLKDRISNSKEEEIKTAAAEQLKITKIRLEKLFDVNQGLKTYEL